MWIVLALLSSLSAGVSVIFQKKGTGDKYILYTSALNVGAMFFMVLAITVVSGSFSELPLMTARCWNLTICSGVVQAASWIFYFLAMKDADVNYMMVLDKFNIVVTMVLAWLIVGEAITPLMLLASFLILGGTVVMAEPGKLGKDKGSRRWILWGLVSPALQAVSNILVKLDTTPVSTSLTTCVRMLVVAVVVFALAWIKEGRPGKIRELGKNKIHMLVLGGAVLGISYLLMYRAIYLGIAAVVTPIVKANILVTTILAYLFLGERLSKRGWTGFAIVCAGVALFLF
jgi:transporter family protein